MIALTGSQLAASCYAPLPQDDPRQRQPDITLARQKLGWEPKVALDEGLDRRWRIISNDRGQSSP